MTSDFCLSDDEAELRGSHWFTLLPENFFEKYGKYVPYILQKISQFRTWRGPIHADEFYRMFCKVVLEKQVWSFKLREWISEDDAMESVLKFRSDLDARYREAVDVATNRVIDSELRDHVLDQCRAVIYGWEE